MTLRAPRERENRNAASIVAGARGGRWLTGIVWSLAAAPPLVAQGSGTIDAGLSAVRYDGFLGSAAAFLAPTLRFDTPSLSALAQGSYVLFESGNRIVQGTAAAAWLSPTVRGVRAEIGATGGLSAYADEPRTGYASARARAHLMGRARGAWLGGAVGHLALDTTGRTTREFAAGGWVIVDRVALAAAATWSAAADSAYLDLTAGAHAVWHAVELDGLVGARTWSDGAGEGVFGDVTVRLLLTPALAGQVSAGRYPSDPVRGTVGGRYLSAGIRLTPFGPRPSAHLDIADLRRRAPRTPDDATQPDAPRLTLRAAGPGHRVVVRATGARAVELAGDFTDWEPLALLPLDDAWYIDLALSPGVYRVNVRVDGGPWTVPVGLAVLRDEFGSTVGILLIQ
ncbi:MAG: glycogen-binding domain-containing protein [Gemmatimonadota bacterium]|nr:glycogen-binding domain-containing protein [Gemmatimonadota bacterium]